MRWARPLPRLPLVALALLGLACAREALPARPADFESEGRSFEATRAARPAYVTPSRIVPDPLPASHLVGELPDGTRQYLVSGIRILERPDGSREQAKTRLPTGLYRPMELPSRFGGGLLLVASAGGTTFLYRAESWLGEMEPLVRLPDGSREVVAGFDRLYVRVSVGNEWIALDPRSFERVPLGPLPEGMRIGPMAFADAWRGALIADVLGPMVSFDGGASWRRVRLPEQAVAVVLEGDDLVFATRSARYRVGADGEVLREEKPTRTQREGRRPSHTERPSLLRAAVEDGFAESNETALIAREGKLFRIRLRDGAVLASRPAYPASLGDCHAIALGEGAGFVCGAPNGPTSLQAFVTPFGLREVARFAEPRLVLPGGTGGVAIRGGCAAAAHEDSPGKERWCVRTRGGAMREVEVQGEQRIVVLGDGRMALVQPPRPGAEGRLTVIEGETPRAVPLDLGGEATFLSQAAWLRGFEEWEPGVLGGWVDGGGEARGVRIELDGKVSLASESVDPQTTIFGGRFALALGTGSHRIRETFDGGFTWKDVELPANLPRAPVEARACGAVGCVVGGWLRVGWGDDEAKTLASPQLATFSIPRVRGLSLRCEPRGEIAPPYRASPTPTGGNLLMRADQLSVLGGPPTSGPEAGRSMWAPFFDVPPPKLQPGEVGFDGGTDPANLRVLAPFRLYAWGPQGASWSRSGKILARFQDRFARGGPYATAVTQAPFADPDDAALVFEPSGGPPVAWTSLPDPSGEAAILLGCRAGRCTSFGATVGGKVVRIGGLELTTGAYASAVRVGTSFYLLAPVLGRGADDELVLYRIDGDRAQEVTRIPRTWADRGDTVPRLVRRVASHELGLLVQGPLEVERGARDWFVVPLDAETGTLGEPVRLVGSHLDGNAPPPRCDDSADGWLVDAHPSPSPLLRVSGLPASSPLTLNSAGVRLRLEPGHACIEALAARAEGLSALPARPATKPSPDAGLPLVAADSATGRRYEFACTPQ